MILPTRERLLAVRNRGFSLLEVMIATGILATSTVLLLGIFSTGQRHAERAETRVLAQMLCQSLLDELLADPAPFPAIDGEPIPGYAPWTYSVSWTPARVEGLVCLRVSVTQQDEQSGMRSSFATLPPPVLELTRWARARPGDGTRDFDTPLRSEPQALPGPPLP